MEKKVWIFNHYAGNTFFEKGGRHYWFAKFLEKGGYEPTVFAANAKHGIKEYFFDMDSLWTEKMAEEINVPYVFVKTRLYDNNGKQRILNMLDFWKNVKKAAKEYAKSHGKPDIILASSVHPFTLVAGIQLAKKYKVKCICEVRDLWPESFVAYGILKKNNVVVKVLRSLEKWIYIHADKIIFTMEGAYDYIIQQRWNNKIAESKIEFINNGTDIELFDYNKKHFCIEDEDLLDSTRLKIVYTGSIRKANQLDYLIDIAKKTQNPNVKFLIWGAGDEELHLKERVKSEKINNVVFKGKVEKRFVPFIVANADYNFLEGMDSSLLKFGLSANKMFDYLAAHKPILTLVDNIFNPIVKMSAGVVLSNDIGKAAKTIDNLPTIESEEYNLMCRNARIASEKYDFKLLTQKLINLIDMLVKNER